MSEENIKTEDTAKQASEPAMSKADHHKHLDEKYPTKRGFWDVVAKNGFLLFRGMPRGGNHGGNTVFLAIIQESAHTGVMRKIYNAVNAINGYNLVKGVVNVDARSLVCHGINAYKKRSASVGSLAKLFHLSAHKSTNSVK